MSGVKVKKIIPKDANVSYVNSKMIEIGGKITYEPSRLNPEINIKLNSENNIQHRQTFNFGNIGLKLGFESNNEV